MENNFSITLNAKQRLQQEKIHVINGQSSHEGMPTKMSFVSIMIRCTRTFTRCIYIKKTTTIHVKTGLIFLFVCLLLKNRNSFISGRQLVQNTTNWSEQVKQHHERQGTSGGNFTQNKPPTVVVKLKLKSCKTVEFPSIRLSR